MSTNHCLSPALRIQFETPLHCRMGSALSSFYPNGSETKFSNSLATLPFVGPTLPMTASIYDKYPASNYIVFDVSVWSNFRTFNGKPEYYLFGGGTKHGGICFRDPISGACGVMELLYASFDDKKKWFTRVRKSKWNPGEATVYTSVHPWKKETVLFIAKEFAECFKLYHALFNNCNHWKQKLVEKMRGEGPPQGIYDVDTLEQFLILGSYLGVHLYIENDFKDVQNPLQL